MAGDIAVMAGLVLVVVIAVLWRPARLGAALLAGPAPGSGPWRSPGQLVPANADRTDGPAGSADGRRPGCPRTS